MYQFTVGVYECPLSPLPRLGPLQLKVGPRFSVGALGWSDLALVRNWTHGWAIGKKISEVLRQDKKQHFKVKF